MEAVQILRLIEGTSALAVQPSSRDYETEDLQAYVVPPSERGFATMLIEMMIVCSVLLILACAALPNMVQIRAGANQVAARQRVAMVAQAELAVAICSTVPTCTPAPGATAILPAPGTIPQQGYNFTFTSGPPWTYVATPQQPGYSGNQSYFVDDTGVVRCGIDGGAQPC